MSQENVELVEQAISAINERDVVAYLSLCNSDVELINPVSAIDGPMKGEQGIRTFFESINDGAAKFELEIDRLQPLEGNRVLGSLILHLETEGGFQQDQPVTNLYELEDAGCFVYGFSSIAAKPSRPQGCLSSRFQLLGNDEPERKKNQNSNVSSATAQQTATTFSGPLTPR